MAVMARHWSSLSVWELAAVGTVLMVAAVLAPLPLYLLALSVFGLPHVLWELRWIRQTYQAQIPSWVWLAWWGVLGLQAAARLGSWLGIVSAPVTLLVDLLALALLFWVVAALAWRWGSLRAWLLAVLAACLGVALLWVVNNGDVVAVLVLLAITHNFTPLFLVSQGQRFAMFPARSVLVGLFSLPLLLIAALWWLGMPAPNTVGWWMPSEATWLQQHLTQGFAAVLSGVVLAQCLHYYSVLRLLPTTLPMPAPRWWLLGAVSTSVLLTLYFLADFNAARQLYAVVAGFHAWLEFPLILLLFSGLGIGKARVE